MKYLKLITIAILITGCDSLFPGVDGKFGKQNFVSAISLIELHKVRNDVYPESLKDLQYLGDWDGIWLSRVRYEKVDGGYNLYVEIGWVGEPDLSFPVGFKKGLGLKESNVKWISN
jgi:hypothetical protein